METISSSRFQKLVGGYCDTVRITDKPLCVRSHGRSGVVVLSEAEYARLTAIERRMETIAMIPGVFTNEEGALLNG